jgi:hypothetical protein
MNSTDSNVAPANQDPVQLLLERIALLERNYADLNSANSAHQHHADPREPKVALPGRFSGARGTYRGFMNQLELVFTLQPSRYNSDQLKIATVGTLVSGAALAWFNPFLENPAKYPIELKSWASFRDSMKRAFSDPDQAIVATHAIRVLKQGAGTASAFAAEFRRLAADLDWNDAAFIATFRSGLSKTIKDLMLHFDYPTSLELAIEIAIRCDNRLHEHIREMSSTTGPASPSIHTPAPQPTPMDLDVMRRGPLTAAERQHRIDNNQCLRCGKSGHYKANCPLGSKPKVFAHIDQPAPNGLGQ